MTAVLSLVWVHGPLHPACPVQARPSQAIGQVTSLAGYTTTFFTSIHPHNLLTFLRARNYMFYECGDRGEFLYNYDHLALYREPSKGHSTDR